MTIIVVGVIIEGAESLRWIVVAIEQLQKKLGRSLRI